MNEAIPQLSSYDEPSLDAAFATLGEEVRSETASLADIEAFRLRWLGRKQGRLRIRRQGKLVLRALEHQQGQFLPERIVDLGQNRAGLRESFRQGLAHADGLRTLSGKNECLGHPVPYCLCRVSCERSEWHCHKRKSSSLPEILASMPDRGSALEKI